MSYSHSMMFVVASLLLVACSMILGKYDKTTLSVLLTCIALGCLIVGVKGVHMHESYIMAELDAPDTAVVRLYDPDGNIVAEFSGSSTIRHAYNRVIVEQDGTEKVIINQDGKVMVVEK